MGFLYQLMVYPIMYLNLLQLYFYLCLTLFMYVTLKEFSFADRMTGMEFQFELATF